MQGHGGCNSDPWVGKRPGGGHGHPLSVLAWRIPRTEEPGGLQSLGLQRVGQVTEATERRHTAPSLLASPPILRLTQLNHRTALS